MRLYLKSGRTKMAHSTTENNIIYSPEFTPWSGLYCTLTTIMGCFFIYVGPENQSHILLIFITFLKTFVPAVLYPLDAYNSLPNITKYARDSLGLELQMTVNISTTTGHIFRPLYHSSRMSRVCKIILSINVMLCSFQNYHINSMHAVTNQLYYYITEFLHNCIAASNIL